MAAFKGGQNTEHNSRPNTANQLHNGSSHAAATITDTPVATGLSLLSDKQGQQVLLTLLLGGTVVSFSNSALNPAIPVFMAVFDVDIVMGGWVLNAYVLAMSVGFMLGSIFGMLASSMGLVIVARAIQGLSGVLIIPLSIGMLYQIYPQHQHGRVMALWGIVIMMSLAFGPLVGAYLVEQFAWWTLFAITIPLSAIVMAMVWWLIPNIRTQDTPATFDTVGFVSLLIWLLAMMVWLSTLKIVFNTDLFSSLYSLEGWLELATLVLLASGFLLSAIVWWGYERRQSQPLLNVRLFSNKTYLHSTIISITQTLGLMLCLLLLPIFIQDVMQESAIWTGIVLMVATLVASVTTHFAGQIVDRRGARNIGILGIIISVLSTLMLVWCLYEPALWLLIVIMSVRGVGVGLAYLPTTTVGFSSLPKEEVTEGAALNNISRRIFSTLFIALATIYIDGRSTQLVAVGSQNSTINAIQEVLIIIVVILLFTLPSACKLPKSS